MGGRRHAAEAHRNLFQFGSDPVNFDLLTPALSQGLVEQSEQPRLTEGRAAHLRQSSAHQQVPGVEVVRLRGATEGDIEAVGV